MITYTIKIWMFLVGLILSLNSNPSSPQLSQKTPLETTIGKGEKVYKTNCLACHMVNGSGVPSLAPTLIRTPYVLGEKPKLIQIVLNGFNEDVEIEGEYFSNPMPAFSHLTDEEIAQVLTYIRNNFGNKADAVTPEEVKKQRTHLKDP